MTSSQLLLRVLTYITQPKTAETKLHKKMNKGCVSHGGLAIYIKKIFEGERRIMETQIFHHAKI